MKNITVAGGGVLGSQIAFQSAYRGFNVTVWLRMESSIGRAEPKFERVEAIYLKTLEAMKTNPQAFCRGFGLAPEATPEEIDEKIAAAKSARERITFTLDYEKAAQDADLVIEAIAENPQEKIEFYTKLAPLLPEKTVIATNSSTMLPSAFAEYTRRPEKYLALHFANEIWRNNTAEIMGHDGTSPEAFKAVVKFAEDIAMIPLELKKEQSGYLLNSMLVPFLNSAQALLANGVADHETIDKTWKLATGAPLGPFQILDIVGLTTAYNIVSLSPEAADPSTTPGRIASTLKSYIDQGKTGVNAGEGFYSYR